MGSFRGFKGLLAFVAAAFSVMVMAGPTSAGLSDIPTATVDGPIAANADSYPYLATDIDLDSYGYVEEEYFLSGQASRYDTTVDFDQTAPRIAVGGTEGDGYFPFKTRIVVRRPANPADANGIVVAE